MTPQRHCSSGLTVPTTTVVDGYVKGTRTHVGYMQSPTSYA